MRLFRVLTMTCVAAALLFGVARADNVGNVTVKGSGTCSAISGTFPFLLGVFQFPSTNTTAYRLSILANISGLPQPQYIVDSLNQIGNATSGAATVFNNGFLNGPNGAITTGTWSGTFSFDQFLDFSIQSLVIVTGSGSSTCTLTFTNGLAVDAL